MLNSIKSPRIVLLLLFVAVQGFALRAVLRPESTPSVVVAPLTALPSVLPGWNSAGDYAMEPNIEQILHPDDYLIRDYQDPTGRKVNLFIGYFKTQRTGHMPHSPKNCLPGTGWTPHEAKTTELRSSDGTVMTVNQYLVQRGSSRSVVLYWYQTHKRVIASEYKARVFLVIDSMKDNRSDTALVRLVSPVVDDDLASATNAALSLAPLVNDALRRHIPR